MTGYRLTWTAEHDLRQILQYVAEQNGHERALHLSKRFEHAFELLASAPRSGRVREKLTGRSVRWWIVSVFAVAYDAERSPIEILRVLHGMRDLEGLV